MRPSGPTYASTTRDSAEVTPTDHSAGVDCNCAGVYSTVGTSFDALTWAGYRKLISTPKIMSVVTSPAVAGTMVVLKAFCQRTSMRSQRERRELATSCESATRNFKASSGGAAFLPNEATSDCVLCTDANRAAHCAHVRTCSFIFAN